MTSSNEDMKSLCRYAVVLAVLVAAHSAMADPSWDVKETADGFDVTCEPGPMMVITQAEGVVVSAGPGSAVVDRGEPDVPVLVRVFRARTGKTARIDQVVADDVREDHARVLPRSFETVETVSDNEVRRVTLREPKEAIYSVDGFWPEVQARVTEASMGTNTYVRLAVYPVQYNPVTQTLRTTEKLRVRVSFDESHAGGSQTGY